MMKKPYVQRLESFPSYYPRLMEFVRLNGRFSVEFLSRREMMGERARVYRYRTSMEHFKPDDPLTQWMTTRMEVRYNDDSMVLEVINRELVVSNLQIALEKAMKEDYTSPAIDQVADAHEAFNKSLEDLARKEAEREREQGNSSE